MMTLPELDIDPYRPALVRMVAETSWLAHPDTVKTIGRAIFPTVRAGKGHTRGAQIDDGNRVRERLLILDAPVPFGQNSLKSSAT